METVDQNSQIGSKCQIEWFKAGNTEKRQSSYFGIDDYELAPNTNVHQLCDEA